MAKIYSERGEIYLIQNDIQKGILDYSNAITNDPKNSSYYAIRAYSFYISEQFDAAIADYNIALNLYSEDWVKPSLYEGRGLSYLAKATPNAIDSSISDFTQCIESYKKTNALIYANELPKCYFSRAYAYLNKNQFQDAISDYDNAIKIGIEKN